MIIHGTVLEGCQYAVGPVNIVNMPGRYATKIPCVKLPKSVYKTDFFIDEASSRWEWIAEGELTLRLTYDNVNNEIKKEWVCCKKFCKNKFATWYSAEVQKQVDSRVNFEDVNVALSVLKPIHGTWLVEMYNIFTSVHGRDHVLKGWEKAGIKRVK